MTIIILQPVCAWLTKYKPIACIIDITNDSINNTYETIKCLVEHGY